MDSGFPLVVFNICNDTLYSLLISGGFIIFIYCFICYYYVPTDKPRLYCSQSLLNRTIIDDCPILREKYEPPYVWGRSGHVQTLLYGSVSRVNAPPLEHGRRRHITMLDGATLTYDLYESDEPQRNGVDCTLMICPGIGSSSESLYVQTFVRYANQHGYRVAVLNHLGAIKNVKLTSPRIFNYGNTDEFSAMVMDVKNMYRDTKLIGVGFSMGGNLLLKYLGEKQLHRDHFISIVVCCTGYDIIKSKSFFTSWDSVRRIYIWAMSLSHQLLLRRHQRSLFSGDLSTTIDSPASKPFDTRKLFRAASMINMFDIDEHYSSRSAGFDSLDDYYKWASSCNYIHEITDLPMMILNSEDDPIIPVELLSLGINLAKSRENIIFTMTKHGGHLGYFEGYSFYPSTITWMDRFIVEYIDSAVKALVVERLPSC